MAIIPRFACTYSRADNGLEAELVRIEVHLSAGIPKFTIVGLADSAQKSCKERVRSALLNSRFTFPQQRITVNLAPADLPKASGRFDLGIAIALLVASRQLQLAPEAHYEFLGELALCGALRPVACALPAAIACANVQHTLITAIDNQSDVIVSQCPHGLAQHLLEVTAFLSQQRPLSHAPPYQGRTTKSPDLQDVIGQPQAKRALEIAAAGGHSLLMSGPPGCGKTMLAQRLPSLLPPLTLDEALTVACIQSRSQQGFHMTHWRQRPFRQPHHTCSAVALAGGGKLARPGEISLAHLGVLFLDELPEFDRKVLEVLREPLESGRVFIARAALSVCYPAAFQLIAAMNPCPCGFYGTASTCRCSPGLLHRYQQKLSGPLLDRMDIIIDIKLPAVNTYWQTKHDGEPSHLILQRIIPCRHKQYERQGHVNAKLSTKQLHQHAQLNAAGHQLMRQWAEQSQPSLRSYHRVIKLARTIADLNTHDDIAPDDLAEAIAFRHHPLLMQTQ